ncbi:MAG: histidinol-phosphate transaminase [Ignavibacteriaceae bacterium]
MKIKNLIRPNILDLKPYTCARDIYSTGILLDANENSLGSTFSGWDHAELNRYPDPHQKDLRKMVGEYYSVPADNLFFGVGSDEIIDLLIRIFCRPGKDKVMIPGPTYGMYKVSSDINAVETVEVLLDDNFQIDEQVIAAAFDDDVKIIFLCSPNNPTGELLKKDDVLNICKKYNAIIAVDEAYIDFCYEGSLLDEVQNYPNLVVMRTFSKAWGLAGIRLGYCAANEGIIEYLFKVKAPYNINSLTRFALETSIKNSSIKDVYVKVLVKERERLKNLLESLKGVIKVYDSDANFILFKCENPKEVQKKLADKGVIIRDRSTQPKLEGCLRVSIGTEEENDIFWEAIKKIL